MSAPQFEPSDSPPAPLEAFETIDLSTRSVGEAYHWMNSTIVPRPIAFITSRSATGVVNAAPFSYFNGVTASPPILSVSIGRRAGRRKDTSRNIVETGEFVVNVCSVAMARMVSVAAGDFAPEESEAELLGLTLHPSVRVSVPRVAHAPIQMECRLDQVVPVGDGPTDLVLGRVLLIHTRKDLLDGSGRLDVARIDPLGRLAGLAFAPVGEPFEVPRGLPEPGRPGPRT